MGAVIVLGLIAGAYLAATVQSDHATARAIASADRHFCTVLHLLTPPTPPPANARQSDIAQALHALYVALGC